MLKELMQQFCTVGEEDGRAVLNEPFQRGGYCVATDGRVCVFYPHDAEDTPGAPAVKWMIERAFLSGLAWQPWPAAAPQPALRIRCEECKGSGHGKKTCFYCNGRGRESCKCGEHTKTCVMCDGTGKSPDRESKCEKCAGEGKVLSAEFQRLPTGDVVRMVDFERVARLPGVEFAREPETEKRDMERYPPAPIALRFAGGRGLVSVVSPKDFE